LCSFLDLLESNTLSREAARMLFHVERSALELGPDIPHTHENVTAHAVQLTPIRAWHQGRNLEVNSGNEETTPNHRETLVKTQEVLIFQVVATTVSLFLLYQ
jgi:hypothetical protein